MAPDQADELLITAASDIGQVLNEIRRAVYGLRPPALDELGLVRAVEQLAERLRTPTLTINLEASADLPALSAAVEVAAYRVICEALTNVVRHSAATNCEISIRAELSLDALYITVHDNGQGIQNAEKVGVGVLSMYERAAELGGETTITSCDRRGTTVHCYLPLLSTKTSESYPEEAESDA